MSKQPRPITLIVLDGWGYRDDPRENAIAKAKTPVFNQLWKEYPHTLISASSYHVGLPKGQMGNSEVGHLNLGAGRIIKQSLNRITDSINDSTFFENKVFIKAIDEAVKDDKAVHVFGLLSQGGIHSHEYHIHSIIKMAAKRGASKIYVHAFLDGRDTPPKSAQEPLQGLEDLYKELGVGKTVSLVGRFFVMDRDKRWDRVAKAYDLFTLGEANRTAKTPLEGLKLAYKAKETDEFVKPTSIHAAKEEPVVINDGDSIIFMNYRADRAREITRAFTDPSFDEFNRKRVVKPANYVCLTSYDSTFKLPIAFLPEKFVNTLGEYLAKQHKKQLRIAETEKYAHVTFFLNGGIDEPNKGEDRILVSSPKVTTYDKSPKMSASRITRKLVKAIKSKKYDAIICNYANCDMLGHTGNFKATVKSVEYLDKCLGKVVKALQKVGGEAIITADHGNAEVMFDTKIGQPQTAHTCSLVPFIYVSNREVEITSLQGSLCDVAPTMLYLMGLPAPKEMTGEVILHVIKH
jgi:2,3-bisphosphoglycerate-independent phosphoglycerate mutase